MVNKGNRITLELWNNFKALSSGYAIFTSLCMYIFISWFLFSLCFPFWQFYVCIQCIVIDFLSAAPWPSLLLSPPISRHSLEVAPPTLMPLLCSHVQITVLTVFSWLQWWCRILKMTSYSYPSSILCTFLSLLLGCFFSHLPGFKCFMRGWTFECHLYSALWPSLCINCPHWKRSLCGEGCEPYH